MSNNIEDKIFINVMLENGHDNEGNMKYVLLPLPDINPNTFNTQKVLNVVQTLAPCIAKSVGGVRKIQGKSLIVLA